MLRPPREGDVETLVEVCVDPEIVRFTRVPSPYARSDAEAFLAAAQEGLVRGDSFLFVIADRETDALLGTISLGIHRASVAPENVASQRVAEKGRVHAGGDPAVVPRNPGRPPRPCRLLVTPRRSRGALTPGLLDRVEQLCRGEWLIALTASAIRPPEHIILRAVSPSDVPVEIEDARRCYATRL